MSYILQYHASIFLLSSERHLIPYRQSFLCHRDGFARPVPNVHQFVFYSLFLKMSFAFTLLVCIIFGSSDISSDKVNKKNKRKLPKFLYI